MGVGDENYKPRKPENTDLIYRKQKIRHSARVNQNVSIMGFEKSVLVVQNKKLRKKQKFFLWRANEIYVKWTKN